ncbi:MAG: PP2C family protein-serine/threonine phosphatase [Bryobacteraceae bacterium]
MRLYFALFLYVLVSLTYHVVGSISLLDAYFETGKHAREPFSLNSDGRTVKADTIESLNGNPYRGRAQWQETVWHARPGDTLRAGLLKADGRRVEIAIPFRGNTGKPQIGEAIFFIVFMVLLPLACLLVGYWVVAARPRDPNAWLILILLSYAEIFMSTSTANWWPGPWLVLRLAWHMVLQIIAPAALLWFGLFFSKRSRIDVRLPWLKWLILAIQIAGLSIGLIADYAGWYNLRAAPWRRWVDPINDRVLIWVVIVCVVLYWLAIFDKVRSAPTGDARRRMRVLCIGSVVGLGSVLLVFGLLPLFGINPFAYRWIDYSESVLFLVFPFTLAYVVVVQRAMDVRILLRMGTKYVLARATLVILQFAIAATFIIRVLVPQIARKQHEALNVILFCIVIALLIRFSVVRQGVGTRLRKWLDRKFFREAYNAELVLSELSEQARRFTETGPLIETVTRKISDVLHVPSIAVFLRGGDGFTAGGPLLLPESSSTVQNLMRTNLPATVYRDNPDEWFLRAGADERRALDDTGAELLLALPGRDRLMGVMALGPKLSEEPYTPSDLRLLQSVGTQTGQALEIGELAHSLATEAARRERADREIEIAHEVQERLFPQRMPVIEGLSLAGFCRPAQGVGGDYYDVVELDDGRLGLAIGDVSGKGISAALLMASLRASLRGMTLETPSDMAAMMRKVNRLVYEASANNRYATFFFSIFDPATRKLVYVNAGHNPPMVIRACETIPLEAGGPVIGLLRDVSYVEQWLILEPGDLLLCYTDGINEAMTSEDEEWGEGRMLAAAQAVRVKSAEEILKFVFTAADEFAAGAEQHDDMTLLVIKLSGDGASP